MQVGWDSSAIAQGSFELTKTKYPGRDQILAFDHEVVERLAQLPGVQAASLSYGLPYDGPFGPRAYLVEGRDRPAEGQEPVATFNGVTDDYFAVAGIHLLRGRAFNAADFAASRKVVIVNESMARALFPNEDAIGRRLAVAGNEKQEWAELVGVVADVRTLAVYRRPIPFQIYHPLAEEPWPNVRFAVRTAGIAPESAVPSLRGAIAGLDPDLPLRELMTAEATIERHGFELTMLRNILGTFSLLGLGLAAMGIYGVLARNVAQRCGEIGIRMALGANVADVVRMVLGSGVRLAAIGTGLGVVGACGLAGLIAGIMPSLKTDNGLVLGVSTGVLLSIALVACWLPARGAARIDPMNALRCE
jgi:predicted permease